MKGEKLKEKDSKIKVQGLRKPNPKHESLNTKPNPQTIAITTNRIGLFIPKLDKNITSSST